MSKVIKYLKDNHYLVIGMMIVLVLFAPYIFFNHHLFIFLGDSYEQQVKFYVEAWQRLRAGSLPFWDWSNFLGNNYFGSSTFYFLGSPFFWLAMFSPKVEWLPYLFLTLNILKSLLGVSFGYIWLKKVGDSGLASLIGGLMITFSGFVMVNYSNNHMLDAIVFVPLILYYVECFLEKRSTLGLSLSIGFLGIVSYYFLYLALPLIFVYVLFRYLFSQQYDLRILLADGLRFTVSALLGVGISAVMLLPSYMALEGNVRGAEISFGLNTIGLKNIYRFITAFFSPVCDWRINSNYFISTEITPGIGWEGGMQVYTSILFPMCVLYLPFIKDRSRKLVCVSLCLFYFICALVPSMYVVFNQNYESRWMMVFSFVAAFTISGVLNETLDGDHKHFLFVGSVIAILEVFFLIASIKMGFTFETWELKALKRNVLILTVLALLYGLLLSKVLPFRKMFIMTLVVSEIVLCFYNCFYNTNDDAPMTAQDYEKLTLFDYELVDRIKEIDDSFYRIDQADVRYFGYNDALSNRYNSFVTYHSVFNYRQNDFVYNRFLEKGSWTFNPQAGKTFLKTLLGSKYWITYKNSKNVPFGYEFCYQDDGFGQIYVNRYDLPFAYYMSDSVSVDRFNMIDSKLLRDDVFLRAVVVSDGGDNLPDTNFVLIKSEGEESDHLKIGIGGGLLGFECENYRSAIGRKIIFYDTDEKEIGEYYLGTSLGYQTVPVPENASSLSVENAKIFNIYYDDLNWLEDWYKDIRICGAKNVKFTDNAISGDIRTKGPGIIMTSVPYDRGWEIYIDGNRSAYVKADLGFVGVPVETAGEYHLEMKYVPPGLYVGACISLASLMSVLLIGRKKNHAL